MIQRLAVFMGYVCCRWAGAAHCATCLQVLIPIDCLAGAACLDDDDDDEGPGECDALAPLSNQWPSCPGTSAMLSRASSGAVPAVTLLGSGQSPTAFPGQGDSPLLAGSDNIATGGVGQPEEAGGLSRVTTISPTSSTSAYLSALGASPAGSGLSRHRQTRKLSSIVPVVRNAGSLCLFNSPTMSRCRGRLLTPACLSDTLKYTSPCTGCAYTCT